MMLSTRSRICFENDFESEELSVKFWSDPTESLEISKVFDPRCCQWCCGTDRVGSGSNMADES